MLKGEAFDLNAPEQTEMEMAADARNRHTNTSGQR